MTSHIRMIPRSKRENDLLKYGRSQGREQVIEVAFRLVTQSKNNDIENLVMPPDSENDVKGVSKDYFAGMSEGQWQERERIAEVLRQAGYPESTIKLFTGETE